MFEPEIFRKKIYCRYWRKYLWHRWNFMAPPAVI